MSGWNSTNGASPNKWPRQWQNLILGKCSNFNSNLHSRRNPALGAEEGDGSSPSRSVIRRNEGEETKEFGERTDRAVGPHSLTLQVKSLMNSLVEKSSFLDEWIYEFVAYNCCLNARNWQHNECINIKPRGIEVQKRDISSNRRAI